MSINKNVLTNEVNPLISVVILAGPGSANRKNELVRGIKSVKKSDYKNYEIILVDNSCSQNLYKSIEAEFTDVKIIRLPQNTGMFGYSTGFINAKGTYILALDDDCTINKDTLGKIINSFKSSPKDVGVISSNLYNPIGKYYYYTYFYNQENKYMHTFPGGASAFKKSMFEKVGYYDESYFCWLHEDDLAIRILNAGYKIRFDENVIIFHHDTKEGYRKLMLYLTFRNKAWFNLKHFSLMFFPLLITRDLVWISLLPIRRRSLIPMIYALQGYIWGYITFNIPLRKRHVVNKEVQKIFLRYYLFANFVKGTIEKKVNIP